MAKRFYCSFYPSEKKVIEFLEKNGYKVKTVKRFMKDLGIDKKYYEDKRDKSRLNRKICISGPTIDQAALLHSIKFCMNSRDEDPEYESINGGYMKEIFGINRLYIPYYYSHYNEMIRYEVSTVFARILYRKLSSEMVFSEYNYVTNKFEDQWNNINFTEFKL